MAEERLQLGCPPIPKTLKLKVKERGADGREREVERSVPTPPELVQWGDNVRALLEVAFGNRPAAEPFRFVTLAELAGSGLIEAALSTGTKLRRNPNSATGALQVDLPNVTVDNRTPETPSAALATPTFKAIILTWSFPSYGFHDHTEVWRNTTNNLTTAVQVKDTTGGTWADDVGTGATYYYWLRHVGTNGRKSAFSSGVTATTGKIVGSDEIQNLTITNALIANLAVDDAKIASLSASKLTAGTIDAGIVTVSNLNATNITAGSLNVARINDRAVDTIKLSENSVSAAYQLVAGDDRLYSTTPLVANASVPSDTNIASVGWMWPSNFVVAGGSLNVPVVKQSGDANDTLFLVSVFIQLYNSGASTAVAVVSINASGSNLSSGYADSFPSYDNTRLSNVRVEPGAVRSESITYLESKSSWSAGGAPYKFVGVSKRAGDSIDVFRVILNITPLKR